jgi:hypothetical protein
VPAIPIAHLTKAPGSAVAVAIAPPKIFREERLHEKHREIWDDVYPESLKEPEYHVFTRRKKWLIIVLVGLTGTLPGLTFNMFLPAVNTIGKVKLLLRKSVAEYTLTRFRILPLDLSLSEPQSLPTWLSKVSHRWFWFLYPTWSAGDLFSSSRC